MQSRENNQKTIKRKYTQGAAGNVIDATYFYYETAPNYNQDLAIVCGGYEKCAPDFEIKRGNYPYYFIKYTIRGKGTLNIKSQSHKLRAGTLSGFAPSLPHHYISDSSEPMEHIFITFLGKQAKQLMQNSLLYSKSSFKTVNPQSAFDILHTIFETGLEKKQFSQQICCNYLRILLLSQGQNVKDLQKNYSRSVGSYLECKKFIDDNFSRISSPQQVADYCNLNPRYISSLFKRYSDNSPHEYLTRLKLNKAANMLLTSRLTIKEIAREVGFDDPYHFSRNFKKFHKLSPKYYRNAYI